MRLIDADALIKELEEQEYYLKWEVDTVDNPHRFAKADAINWCVNTIRNAETIKAEQANKIKWIPVKFRELDAEEREYYGDEYTCMADCKLPDDGDEILISRNNGLWVSLVEFCNDDYITDSDGNDWLLDVDAWMPLPKGYKVKE